MEVQNLLVGEPGNVHLITVSAVGQTAVSAWSDHDSQPHACYGQIKKTKNTPLKKTKQKGTMPEIDAF